MEHLEIVFAFLPMFMEKGYAVEISAATMSFVVGKLMLPVILAMAAPNNKASTKFLEKIRLRFSKVVRSPKDSKELFIYSN